MKNKLLIVLVMLAVLLMVACGSANTEVSATDDNEKLETVAQSDKSEDRIDIESNDNKAETETNNNNDEQISEKDTSEIENNAEETTKMQYQSQPFPFNGFLFDIPEGWSFTTENTENGPFYMNNAEGTVRCTIKFSYSKGSSANFVDKSDAKTMYETVASSITSSDNVELLNTELISISGRNAYRMRYISSGEVSIDCVEYLLVHNDYLCTLMIMQKDAFSDENLSFAEGYCDHIKLE